MDDKNNTSHYSNGVAGLGLRTLKLEDVALEEFDNVPEKPANDSGNTVEEKGGGAAAGKVESARPWRRKLPNFMTYPAGVYFILGAEFCERFSFFGIGAILTIYLLTIHKMSEYETKLVFHLYVAVCYFVPVLGSLLADGYLGRYRVILYGSIVYCLGHVCLSTGAIPIIDRSISKTMDLIGLFIIALSTGCIKPCVSVFAADQFPPGREADRDRFFSFFYFLINLGAVLSSALTPSLRYDVKCFGESHCFPLAFGIPAILMFMALAIFIGGRKTYVIPPKPENIIAKVFACIWTAIKNRNQPLMQTKHKNDSRNHWLYKASNKFDEKLIDDTRAVLRLSVLFLPVVAFWALYSQQGSSWIIQANAMNGRLGKLTILPEQIGIINPILVIIFVPIFDSYVVPWLKAIRLLETPLKQMNFGGIFVALSFVVCGFVQLSVDKTAVQMPPKGQTRTYFVNFGSRDLFLTSLKVEGNFSAVAPGNNFSVFDIPNEVSSLSYTTPETDQSQAPFSGHVSLRNATENSSQTINARVVTFYTGESLREGGVLPVMREFPLAKSDSGNSTLLIARNPSFEALKGKEELHVSNGAERYYVEYSPANQSSNGSFAKIGIRPKQISSPEYSIVLFHEQPSETAANADAEPLHRTNKTSKSEVVGTIAPEMGGVYGFFMDSTNNVMLFELVSPNSVSLLLQLIPYVIITIGELFFSIIGLMFAYNEAPPSMKSVVVAGWLITISLGNVVDFIIAGTRLISDAATEFFVYASLLVAVNIVFAVLSMKYEYRNPSYRIHAELSATKAA